jgi:hypothetical protein
MAPNTKLPTHSFPPRLLFLRAGQATISALVRLRPKGRAFIGTRMAASCERSISDAPYAEDRCAKLRRKGELVASLLEIRDRNKLLAHPNTGRVGATMLITNAPQDRPRPSLKCKGSLVQDQVR